MNSRPSVMKHIFSEVPKVDIPRSTFDRSHGYKTTFDAGYLVPILLDEALPGDTFHVNLTGFARLATPVFPIMDNMRMETFFFAVPHRLIWDKWQRFCGERTPDIDSTIDFTVPVIQNVSNAPEGSIYDYFGIPTKVAANIDISALPFRAYNLIYNEWFRDQNLIDTIDTDTDDGPDAMADYTLLKRGKRHDYFTSCLPWLQKGDAVQVDLGTSAKVGGTGIALGMRTLYDPGTGDIVVDMGSIRGASSRSAQFYPNDLGATIGDAHTAGGLTWIDMHAADPDRVVGVTPDLDNSGLYADLSTAIGPTVNQLRQAIQVQRILERDARSGTRYTEIIKSHFGVNSEDMRMQRPEYLGGGSTPINITPVAQTDTNVGKLAAFGTASFGGHGFTKSFTEHCIIIGLVNVRADLTYQQGLDRMFSRETRYDFYWPSLAHLGEQAVLNKEIYLDAAGVGNGTYNDVFGYQERFAEYRYKPSKITGLFRSNATTSLEKWHLSQEFASQPILDEDFITEDPPIDRVIATPAEPHFIFDSYIQMKCARPMPLYAVPGLSDHF